MSPGPQPLDGHTSDSVGPSDAENSRHLDPTPTVPSVKQIISNARGGFPQLEMVNIPRSPTKPREDKTRRVDTLVERFAGVSCALLSPD
jgi:hypothetical protein